MKVKGTLLKVDNYESNSDRKLIIRLPKEACPEDILKYQHEEVEIDLSGNNTGDITMQSLHEKQDAIMDLTLQSAKLVKEMAEDKPASGHALQNNIAFQDKE